MLTWQRGESLFAAAESLHSGLRVSCHAAGFQNTRAKLQYEAVGWLERRLSEASGEGKMRIYARHSLTVVMPLKRAPTSAEFESLPETRFRLLHINAAIRRNQLLGSAVN